MLLIYLNDNGIFIELYTYNIKTLERLKEFLRLNHKFLWIKQMIIKIQY